MLYLPEAARFSCLLNLPERKDIGREINEAMGLIEQENPEQNGVLPKSYQKVGNDSLATLPDQAGDENWSRSRCLLQETPAGNLPQVVCHNNRVCTICFNVKRKRSVHLFQVRCKAILGDAFVLSPFFFSRIIPRKHSMSEFSLPGEQSRAGRAKSRRRAACRQKRKGSKSFFAANLPLA